MPVTANRYFNNDQIGQAFSNLAQAFAPPSGGDLAGYATANAKKQEAARLAELFSYAHDPSYDKARADQLATAAGVYNPSQSYYAVDQGNLTSRQNNTADNARAVLTNGADNTRALEQTRLDNIAALQRRNAQDIATTAQNDADNIVLRQNNTADNTRALEQTRLGNTKDITVAAMSPVGVNETRFNPPSIASLFNVPEKQIGAVSAQPGEQITLPDKRVISGVAKPLSETEWLAQQQDAAFKKGLITDQDIADAVMGKNTPVTVLKAGVPTFMTPGAAARNGATAYVNKGPEAKPVNYRTPDGKQGTATQVGDTLVDTQTGLKIPPNSTLFSMTAQGTPSELGMSTNANQTDATKLESQLKYGKQRLADYRKLLVNNAGITGLPGMARGFFQDLRAGLQDLSAAYGKDAPSVFKSLDDVTNFANQMAQKNSYDPAIAQAGAYALEMAYNDAKAADPSGEVNVKEMERYLDKYDGGLAGNQRVLANLDVLEQSMDTRLNMQVGNLRNPSTAIQPTAENPAKLEPEVWERGPDGKLQRKQ